MTACVEMMNLSAKVFHARENWKQNFHQKDREKKAIFATI